LGGLLLFASAADAKEPKWGDISATEWDQQPPPSNPEAAAIVLFDRCVTRVTLEGVECTRHKRIKVFRGSALGEAGEVELVFYKRDRIRGLRAMTVTRDGHEIRVDVDNVFEKEAGDWRTRSFAWPGVEDGAILEFEYIQSHDRLQMLDDWYFQSGLYTLSSAYTLHLVGGFTYNVHSMGIPQGTMQREDAGFNEAKFTWTMQNLPASAGEPLAAAPLSHLVSLHCQIESWKEDTESVSFIESWQDLGDAIEDAYDDYASGGRRQMRDIARTILALQPTMEDTLRMAYEWVRDSLGTLRDDGVTDFLFESAKDDLVDRSATANAKNIILVNLLKAVKIEAWPVLIATRDHRVFQPGVHQLHQFNRVLCQAESRGRSVMMDASAEYTPFPHLPSRDLVAGGLLLDGHESDTITVDSQPRVSFRELTSSVWLRDDGSALCSSRVVLAGHCLDDNAGWIRDLPETDVLKSRLLRDPRLDARIVEAMLTDDSGVDTATVDLVIEVQGMGRRMGTELLVTPMVLWHEPSPFTAATRVLPIDFQRPSVTRTQTLLWPPAGTRLTQLPAPVDQITPAVSFRRVIHEGEQAVLISSMLSVNKTMVPPGEYPALKQLFDMVDQCGTEQVIAASK